MTTLIIGAGFAGLAAGYTLNNAGKDVTILEARDRIGGRAWTDRTFTDIPIEFGGELIHGHKVSTWDWVKKLNLRTIHWEKIDDSMVRLEDGRWLTMAEARATSPDFDLTRSWDIDNIPVKPDDESFGDYLRRIGFTDEQLQYVRRSFANAEGDDMRFLSAESIISAFNDFEHEPGSGDFRILDGYDAIYNHLAKDLDIHLNCNITDIVWDANGVTVTATDGAQFTGDTAIITLPVGVLKANHITFTPPLPDIKTEALSGMAMGPIIKLIYEFAAPLMDRKIGAIYSKHNPPMWWSPSLGRDENTVVWTAFITGDYAREMDALGEAAAIEKGLNTLRTELNQPDLNYKQARWINWQRDEFSIGGYSHCRAGHADAREKLATPTPPLYWAGEATAPHVMMATIHGAYFTGERAAHEILNTEKS